MLKSKYTSLSGMDFNRVEFDPFRMKVMIENQTLKKLAGKS